MGRADWGSVPAWLGLAGGSTALFSYISSRLDVRRSAAATVFVYVGTFKYASAERDQPDCFTNFKIKNDTPMPILSAEVSVWEFGKRRWFWRVRKFTEWMTSKRLEGRMYHAIEPHSSVENPPDKPLTAPRFPTKRPESPGPPITLVFRDGNGRRWVRWYDGRLNRVWWWRF